MSPHTLTVPCYPSLCRINNHAWLTEWSRSLGKRATPDKKTDCNIHLAFTHESAETPPDGFEIERCVAKELKH